MDNISSSYIFKILILLAIFTNSQFISNFQSQMGATKWRFQQNGKSCKKKLNEKNMNSRLKK